MNRNTCSWNERVEAFHDGELAQAKGVDEHLRSCGDCREYLALLQHVRTGVAAVKKDVEIADAQFRVFMDGVREGIEAPRTGWVNFWSRISLVAAGFVLVVALSYIITAGPVRTWAQQYFDSSVDTQDLGPGKPGQAHPENGDLNPKTKHDL